MKVLSSKRQIISSVKLQVFLILSLVIYSIFHMAFSVEWKEWFKGKGLQLNALQSNPILYVQSIPKSIFSSAINGDISKEIGQIKIDIKFKDLTKILKYRNIAISRGITSKREKQYVKANITYKGVTIKAKVRLKGDWTDHLLKDKWSLRVKLAKGRFIEGMNEFSIQSPSTRDFQGSILMNKMFKEDGILTPKMFMVTEIINGDDRGYMFIQEHFSKYLPEMNKRREGVIIKFSEENLWESRIKGKLYESSYSNADINAFSIKKIKKKEKSKKNLALAIGLLRGFLNNTLEAHQVFDIELMAKYIAISDLWGDNHGLIWHNLRFYYNPITARLEPIAYDQLPYHFTEPPYNRSDWTGKLLSNPYMKLAYRGALRDLKRKVSNQSYTNDLIKIDDKYESLLRPEFFLKPPKILSLSNINKRIDDLIRNNSKAISFIGKGKAMAWHYNPDQKDNMVLIIDGEAVVNKIECNKYSPELGYFGPKAFNLKHVDYGCNLAFDSKVDKIIDHSSVEMVSGNDIGKSYTHNVRAYLVKDDNSYSLEVYSSIPDYILIEEIEIEKFTNNPMSIKVNKYIAPKEKGVVPQPAIIDINSSYMKDLKRIRILVSGKYIDVINYPKMLTKSPIPIDATIENIIDRPYMRLISEDTVEIIQGEWDIDEPIVIPPGYILNINKGVELNFTNGSYLLVNGGVSFNGEIDSPIILTSKDHSWKGVTVLGNSSAPEVNMSNVVIKNGSNISIENWELSGFVNFYKTQVMLNNVKIINSSAEDALNIINSNIDIELLEIDNTLSDGFDLDFSHGKISNSIFKNIGRKSGGDAIDLSGSNIKVSNIMINHVTDKGVSAGEGSTFIGSDILISDIGTGIVSKDGSNVDISNVEIKYAKYAGLMSFTKKTQFQAQSNITGHNISVLYSGNEAVSGINSIIELNGNRVKSTSINPKKLYNTIMKSVK
jgi:hypothetical protein